MRNNLRGLGPPPSLNDSQVAKLREFQDLTLNYAKRLVELLPDVEDREKALEALREVQLRGEVAIRIGRTVLTPAVVTDLFTPIHVRDLLVSRLWVNAHEWADLMKTGRDVIDVNSHVDQMRRGYYGKIWTTDIMVSRKIPQGYVYVTASDEGDTDLASDWQPDPSKLVKL